MSVVCNNDYETKLFRAAFSIAFHGFMRVGELSVGSKNNQMHTVAIENINIFDNKLEVLLTSSKTDQVGAGTTICILSQRDKNVCPVRLMANYIKDRPPYPGPLFCHEGNQITRYQVLALLKRSLSILGIEHNGIRTHSFRIGMATTCSVEGIPDEQIKKLGRWKSEAYLCYIRI